MSYLDAIILGIIQGLTEFLPVSSSGHLVLAGHLLGAKQPGVAFEVILHLGTLLSVLVYFRGRIWNILRAPFDDRFKSEKKLWGYLIIATIPAVIFGLTFKDQLEEAFSEPFYTSVALIITACILFVSRYFKNAKGKMRIPTAVAMGFGQAFAIFPGISRSGSTIVAGMMAKTSPMEVAEFSFLMAIPAIGGAAVLELGALLKLDAALIGPYLVGAVASFLFGLGAVYAVLSVIKRGRFEFFAFYCLALGLVGLYLF